jgi:hypothetical protein
MVEECDLDRLLRWVSVRRGSRPVSKGWLPNRASLYDDSNENGLRHGVTQLLFQAVPYFGPLAVAVYDRLEDIHARFLGTKYAQCRAEGSCCGGGVSRTKDGLWMGMGSFGDKKRAIKESRMCFKTTE